MERLSFEVLSTGLSDKRGEIFWGRGRGNNSTILSRTPDRVISKTPTRMEKGEKGKRKARAREREQRPPVPPLFNFDKESFLGLNQYTSTVSNKKTTNPNQSTPP